MRSYIVWHLTESFNPKLSALNLTAVLSAGYPILFTLTVAHTHSPARTQTRNTTSGESVISTEGKRSQKKKNDDDDGGGSSSSTDDEERVPHCKRISHSLLLALSVCVCLCVWCVPGFCNPFSALFFSSRRILSYVMQTEARTVHSESMA